MNECLSFPERVKQYLQEEHYSSVKALGQGSFGEVLSAFSCENKNVAIKVIRNQDSWQMEEKVWPVLKHPFILPVLQFMDVEEIGCKLYVMPLHPDCLHEMVQQDSFRSDCNALLRVKKWFLEVLSALHYLHFNRLCHLDIKADNVLISRNDSAVLCDFSGIHPTGIPIRRFVSPIQFRPPECFSGGSVQGEMYDMWTFGLLALNVLTNHTFSRLVSPFSAEQSWENAVKSNLEQILQVDAFSKLMAEAMPSVPLVPEDCELALDFVKGLLRCLSQVRLTAEDAGYHDFLNATATETVKYCGRGNGNFLNQEKSTGEKIFGVSIDKDIENSSEEIIPIQNETLVVVSGKEEKAGTACGHSTNTMTRILMDLNPVGGATEVDICGKEYNMKRNLLHNNVTKKQRSVIKIRPPARIKKWFLKNMRNAFKRRSKYEILENDFEMYDN